MRIVLRPGHGLTPPGPLAYSRYNGPNADKPDSLFRKWSLQRPGNKEDLYTARFCGEHLIPALVAAGHTVVPQRAMDPVTGELDRTETAIGPDVFPQLDADQVNTSERWQYNASVEAVLQGAASPEWQRGYGWSHDPVISCWWERQDPGDVYLSIHQNWWGNDSVYGPVVMHCDGSVVGASLASSVYQNILDAFSDDPWSDGAKIPWGDSRKGKDGSRWMILPSRLWELRRTHAPAVLVELAFASNPDDRARMDDPGWRQKMADAIVGGLK